ncbi:hypothetical protein JaAD80_27365 [Janthinobacterium sp. AD80]|nr:hypothetical protein JaAD80_27365 [Janthinobacterium sp. AD80]
MLARCAQRGIRVGVVAGAHANDARMRRRHVGFAADDKGDGRQQALRQMRDLAAHGVERQAGRLFEVYGARAGGQDDGRRRRDQRALRIAHQPFVFQAFQAQGAAGKAPRQQAAAGVEHGSAHGRRARPAAFGKPPAAIGRRRAQHGASLRRFQPAREFRRIHAAGGDLPLHVRMLGIARQLQHAALRALDGGADAAQAMPVAQRVQVGGARQARGDVVILRQQRHEDAGQVARGLAGRLRMALHQGHFPAARGQPFAGGRAGHARTDDDGAALGGESGFVLAAPCIKHGAQAALVKHEAVLLQRHALRFIQVDGMQLAAVHHQPRQHRHGGRHPRQVDHVDLRHQLRQASLRFADQHIESDEAIARRHAVQARHAVGPLHAPLVRQMAGIDGTRRQRDVVQMPPAMRGAGGAKARAVEIRVEQDRDVAHQRPARQKQAGAWSLTMPMPCI